MSLALYRRALVLMFETMTNPKTPVSVCFPPIASSYAWLREALNIILLSKNLSRQDLRPRKLDDDRRNDSMDDHYRIPVHLPLRYQLQCQLGNYPRKPEVLQWWELPTGWIRCDGCFCGFDLIDTTSANSQYTDALQVSKSNDGEGMAAANANPAKSRCFRSPIIRLDVSIRTSTLSILHWTESCNRAIAASMFRMVFFARTLGSACTCSPEIVSIYTEFASPLSS